MDFLCDKALCQVMLIGIKTPYRYMAAQEEPDPSWFTSAFDDSGWVLDTGRIGYGVSFAEVTIPSETKSLYIRYKFNLDNPSAIKEMSFIGDYDDGYVAYMNGKELVRRNIDASIRFPAFNDITFRSHENEEAVQYPVLGYYFDESVLDTLLVEGENTVAVHVLNDTLNGSDLFFYLRLYNLTNSYYNFNSPPYRYKRPYTPDSFDFPIVVINTDEYGIPYKNKRVKAFMGIIDNGPGAMNTQDDSCNVYYGDVSIEVRGNSSSEFPKRSYRFELIDSAETDSNVVLLGMPRDNDWILYGPFQDKAQFRNPMVFDLARKFGRYQPRTRFCEMILNGEYQGLYSLTETIKREKDRVDIQKLKPSEISGNDVTGGYILRYDKGAYGLQIVYPKEDNLQPEQSHYIGNFMNEYHAALFSDDFRDPEIGYGKYMSDTTLVDHMIMTEFMKNCDGYVMSTYFYKDRADKDNRIKYGPLWDNDLVFGNTQFQDGADPTGWHFEYVWPADNEYIHILRFLQDTAFVHLFQNRWFEARQKQLQTDSLMNYIDSMVTYLHNAVERNYYLWPVIDKDIFYSNYVSLSYDDEIANIKDWILQRLDWIDDHIGDIYYDVEYETILPRDNPDSYFTLQVYPNPFTEELNLAILSSETLGCRIEIFDVNDRLKYARKQTIENGDSEIKIEGNEISGLTAGFYMIRLTLDDATVITRKVLKR
jgi:hypothetical protein